MVEVDQTTLLDGADEVFGSGPAPRPSLSDRCAPTTAPSAPRIGRITGITAPVSTQRIVDQLGASPGLVQTRVLASSSVSVRRLGVEVERWRAAPTVSQILVVARD